jgi:peptidoglycan/LPS O-acetylase OafA/YrhL
MRAISDGVYGVYRHGTSRFNPVVWTMRSELIGSLIVFAFYRWWPARHRRLGLALFVAGGLADSSCLCFAFGAVLWEGWRAGWRCGPAWSWVIFLLALALSLAPSLHPLRAGHQAPLLAVAAGLLVFGVLMLPSLQAFLGSRGPRFLGRISFALYLLHLPLLLTAGAWLFLHLDGPYLTRVLVVSPLFVGASVVLAWLMTVVLDEPLLRWLHRWRKVRGVVAS